jgi:hypothetical protein
MNSSNIVCRQFRKNQDGSRAWKSLCIIVNSRQSKFRAQAFILEDSCSKILTPFYTLSCVLWLYTSWLYFIYLFMYICMYVCTSLFIHSFFKKRVSFLTWLTYSFIQFAYQLCPLPPLLQSHPYKSLPPLPPPLLRGGQASLGYSHPVTSSTSRTKLIPSHWGPTKQSR